VSNFDPFSTKVGDVYDSNGQHVGVIRDHSTISPLGWVICVLGVIGLICFGISSGIESLVEKVQGNPKISDLSYQVEGYGFTAADPDNGLIDYVGFWVKVRVRNNFVRPVTATFRASGEVEYSFGKDPWKVMYEPDQAVERTGRASIQLLCYSAEGSGEIAPDSAVVQTVMTCDHPIPGGSTDDLEAGKFLVPPQVELTEFRG
jgi:hypothetical protein